jgi:hypothetical protein
VSEQVRKQNYWTGFYIALAIVIVGFVIEVLTGGHGVKMPGWPINFIIFIFFIIYILGIHFFIKGGAKAWLSSIYATIGAITVYSILVLLMGFILQDDSKASRLVRLLGLSHLNRSWEFTLISIYLLLILGLVVLRRLKDLRAFKNLAFFFNHAGIWIVIAAASLGTGDLQRLTMPIEQGHFSNVAFNRDSSFVVLPFTIRLKKFYLQKYKPSLQIYDPRTRRIFNSPDVDYTIAKGKVFHYDGWTITIDSVIWNAVRTKDGFMPKDTISSETAALISAKSGYLTRTAWVSTGTYTLPSVSVYFTPHLAISLSLPEEKKYMSIIDIIDRDTVLHNIKILVNHPVKYKGYQIYQSGFDLKHGAVISILEVVRDPWLPVVYLGLIMLTIGAFMLFWTGKIR